MAWFVLVVAGLLEIGWAVGLKYTHGFTRPLPTVATLAAVVGSMFLLARATRSLPLGTAYGIWVGIGTVGTAIAGMVLFGESAATPRLVWLAVIVAGIVGLKLSS
jgi:quaternary ammonium compound-resistance protein SugE